MNTKNNHGPRQVPPGRQASPKWCLCLRKCIIQLTAVGFTPILNSLATRMLWFTKSKALRESKSTVLAVAAVPSVACSQWWSIEISAIG